MPCSRCTWAIVLFVVAGLVLVVAGNLRHWPWVNHLWFRLAHLAAIAVVVAESWFGMACPLTTLEMWLRAEAGGPLQRRLRRALAAAPAVLRRAALGFHARLHLVRPAGGRDMVVLSSGFPPQMTRLLRNTVRRPRSLPLLPARRRTRFACAGNMTFSCKIRKRKSLMEIVSDHEHGIEVFWGEIAPCEHLVQIYDEEGVFLDSLEGFVAGGLGRRRRIVVIATPAHRRALEDRLGARGLDVEAARAKDQYIALDAAKPCPSSWSTVGRTMTVQGSGDAAAVPCRAGRQACARLRRNGGDPLAAEPSRRDGATGAPLAPVLPGGSLSRCVRYPKSGFTRDATDSIQEICDAHSRVVPA